MGQIIDIEGIGQVEFPDDMSDDQITNAIRMLPERMLPEYEGSDKVTSVENKQPEMWGAFKGVADKLDELTGWDKNQGRNLQRLSTEFVRGIPILGQFAGDDVTQEKFRQANPILSTGANIGGTVASTIPLSAGVATNVINQGGKTASHMLSQGGLFSGLNIADLFTEKGKEGELPSKDEFIKSGVLGQIGGMLGPLVSKFISPNAITKPAYIKPTPVPKLGPKTPVPNISPEVREAAKKSGMTDEAIDDFLLYGGKLSAPSLAQTNLAIQRVLNKQRADKINQGIDAKYAAEIAALENKSKDLFKDLAWSGGGALGGFMFGGVPGAAIGAVSAPIMKHYGPEFGRKYIRNNLMASPRNKAIMNVLFGDTLMGADELGQ